MNEVNGLSFKREYGETFNNSGDSDCLYFTNKVLIWLKKYSNPRQEFVCHVLDGNHVDCGTGAVGIYVSQNKTMYFSSAIPASLGGWLSTDEYTFVTIFDYKLNRPTSELRVRGIKKSVFATSPSALSHVYRPIPYVCETAAILKTEFNRSGMNDSSAQALPAAK